MPLLEAGIRRGLDLHASAATLCSMMYEQGGGHGPPPFSVVVVTCGSDEELPCLDAPDPTDPTEGPFLVGMAGISYKVQIHWNEEVDLGLCQFRLHLDGNFVGYTRVRHVVHGIAGYVEFNGFMVNKGETSTERNVLEYRKFEFRDPSTLGEDAKYIVSPTDQLGKMSIEVFKYQQGQQADAARTYKLWGSVASQDWGFAPVPESKKFFQGPSLATAPGEKFLRTISFTHKKIPGRKVGPPIFEQKITYATVSCLVRKGVLKSSIHNDIIQWALHQLPSYRDHNGCLSSEPSEADCATSRGHAAEVIDLCSDEPVIYTHPVPPSIIDDLCDLTGGLAIWSRRPKCPHEVIDLTEEERDFAQELVNHCLDGADILEEVDMMDLDDYMESSRGF